MENEKVERLLFLHRLKHYFEKQYENIHPQKETPSLQSSIQREYGDQKIPSPLQIQIRHMFEPVWYMQCPPLIMPNIHVSNNQRRSATRSRDAEENEKEEKQKVTLKKIAKGGLLGAVTLGIGAKLYQTYDSYKTEQELLTELESYRTTYPLLYANTNMFLQNQVSRARGNFISHCLIGVSSGVLLADYLYLDNIPIMYGSIFGCFLGSAICLSYLNQRPQKMGAKDIHRHIENTLQTFHPPPTSPEAEETPNPPKDEALAYPGLYDHKIY